MVRFSACFGFPCFLYVSVSTILFALLSLVLPFVLFFVFLLRYAVVNLLRSSTEEKGWCLNRQLTNDSTFIYGCQALFKNFFDFSFLKRAAQRARRFPLLRPYLYYFYIIHIYIIFILYGRAARFATKISPAGEMPPGIYACLHQLPEGINPIKFSYVPGKKRKMTMSASSARKMS